MYLREQSITLWTFINLFTIVIIYMNSKIGKVIGGKDTLCTSISFWYMNLHVPFETHLPNGGVITMLTFMIYFLQMFQFMKH